MNTKIRLQSSWLLNDLFDLKTEKLDERLEVLKVLWGENEKSVLDGFKNITGLEFTLNYIDVFVVLRESLKRSISHPLILRIGDNQERNMCILVHELIHNLMWDNVQNDNWSIKIKNLYPAENRGAAIHIAVHAIIEAVYCEVLNKPEVIEKDITIFKDTPDYGWAWEIVRQEGYKGIIAKLKNK